MARRKTVAEVSPPPPSEEAQKASRLDRFRQMVAEHHSERVNVAPPKIAPQSSVAIQFQTLAEKRAAEESGRAAALAANGGTTVVQNMTALERGIAAAQAAMRAKAARAAERELVASEPKPTKQEPVWQPAKLGFQGQKLEPKNPNEYDQLADALRFDVEEGKTAQSDARMILQAYSDGRLSFYEAWNLDTDVIRERLRTFKPHEVTQDSVKIAKADITDDKHIGYVLSQTGVDERPSERAIRYRIQFTDGDVREGFLEPKPRESQSAAIKRAETHVRRILLERPSGVSAPPASAPVGPQGDLGVTDGVPRNHIRVSPSVTVAPTWGQVMGPDGWGERIMRSTLIQQRVKGTPDLDVGRKRPIMGRQATTTPSKPAPLNRPWMRAGSTHCVDPRQASAPPRSVKLNGER